MIAALDAVARRLGTAYLAAAALALFALVPMAGWLVFGRYVLNASPTWVEATSLVLMLVVTFAVAAAATRSREHLAIHFVRDSAPPGLRKAMHALSDFLMLVFGAAMVFASTQNTLNTWSRDIPLLNIPEGIRHLPLVIGGVGIAFFAFVNLIDLFAHGVPDDGEEDPVDVVDLEPPPRQQGQ